MPATRNIQSSILFALPFIGYQPADISNGEPALDAANIIKQTILGPPFKWPWNRTPFDIEIETTDADGNPTTPAQDYELDTSNYGFLEKAWLTDIKTGGTKEITMVTSLAAENAIMRPQSIAVQTQDDDGIVLRLNSLPDKAYMLSGLYQKAPNLMTSLASSWAPIPDNLSYIYDWGFLGMLSMITKDARQPMFAQKFVSHLLGAQDGLTATQRNIFIGDWLTLTSEAGRVPLTTQQGVQARGAS
jgi:hypothetical protein